MDAARDGEAQAAHVDEATLELEASIEAAEPRCHAFVVARRCNESWNSKSWRRRSYGKPSRRPLKDP